MGARFRPPRRSPTIVWLNGGFGAGKTTLARELQGRVLGYDNCYMESGASLPTANASGGDAFLVVPVPEPVGLATRGLCNGKTPRVP